MIVQDWPNLLHLPDFYRLAMVIHDHVPYDDPRWVNKYDNTHRLQLESPLGIRSEYSRLFRVKDCVEHLGLEPIDETVSEFMPDFLFPRAAKRNMTKDGREVFVFGSLVFIWADDPNQKIITGLSNAGRNPDFPSIVEVKHLRSSFKLSDPHDHMVNYRRTPALKASQVFVLWVDENNDYRRAAGPASLAFRNYREFWTDGKFKRAAWDGHAGNWPVHSMKRGVEAADLDKFVAHSKGTNLRSNRFFTDERDEFNFMTEFQTNV